MDEDRSYDAVRVKVFDPLTMVFDEWYYGELHYLVGAKNTRVFYLLKTAAGLLANMPTPADPTTPTEVELAAIEKHHRHQLELYSVLMLCLPKHLQHVANEGQPVEHPHGRLACERLVAYYHENDPGYLPDLSASVHNLNFKDCDNSAEVLIYRLDLKCGLLARHPEYAVPVQTRITILIRALKADSRFDHVIQEHTVNPYAGAQGYENLKRVVVSFARRFATLPRPTDPADNVSVEQALNLQTQRPPARGRGRRTNRNGERLCFNCGKPGHFARECKEQKANGDGL